MNDQTVTTSKRSIRTAIRRRVGVWLGSGLVIAATVAILAFLAWWKYQQIEAAANMPPPPEMPTAVGIQPVGTVSWRNSTSSVGTILAPRSITVNNELPGTVSEVLFQPGSLVEAGAVLLRQDITVEAAQLKAAEAREAFTKSTFERNKSMAESAAITKSELEERESQWLQAKSQVEELNAVIARKTIRAPFAGRVGLTDTHEGQYLAAGTMITTLQSVEGFYLVDFMLPQGIDNQVQVGDSVDVINREFTLAARIVALDSQADRSTRNVRVRARLDSPPDRLQPGDSVQVVIEYGPKIVLPGVPAEALRSSPQGSFVFVADNDKEGNLRAMMRPAIVGTSVGNMIGLASGVKEGEQIIVEGSFKLNDGALVMPVGTGDKGPPTSTESAPAAKTANGE